MPHFTKEVRLTKLDVGNHRHQGALRGIRDRPMVLKRFVNGAEAPPFFPKRAPSSAPSGSEP